MTSTDEQQVRALYEIMRQSSYLPYRSATRDVIEDAASAELALIREGS